VDLVARQKISPFHVMALTKDSQDDEDDESAVVDELVNGSMVLARRPGKFLYIWYI
jgi:hypothetical protein